MAGNGAGKYLDNKELKVLVNEWGNDLSFRAKKSRHDIAAPQEERQNNRNHMIEAACVYVGLKMLLDDRARPNADS